MNLVYFIYFDKEFESRQNAIRIRPAGESRHIQRGVALRIFGVMLEPFEDNSTQGPLVRRAISKYGCDHIARQMLVYVREPFRDFFGRGLHSFIDGLSPLIRLFGQAEPVMAKAFMDKGVHGALIKRVWKVIRQDLPGEEVPIAYHESLASISQ